MQKSEIALERVRKLILSGEFPSGSKLPSERELAQKFKLSQGTVAKAISMLANEGIVRKRHGSGNYIESTQSSRPKQRICFLIERLGEQVNPIWHLIFESFYLRIREKGTDVSFRIFSPEDADVTADLDNDGVIVAALSLTPARVKALTESGRRILWLSEYPAPLPGPTVCFDNFAAGAAVAKHLLEQGCEKLLYLTYAFETPDASSARRFEGLLSAVSASGAPCPLAMQPCYTATPDFKDTLLPLLSHDSGVLCFNDQLAACVMRVAMESGLRLPHDFALAGVDGLPFADSLPIPLTTVRQPCGRIGRLAAETAMRMLAGEKLEGALKVEPELVVRESSLRLHEESKAI